MNNIHQIHSFREASLFTSDSNQEQELHSPPSHFILEKKALAWGRAVLGKDSGKAMWKTTLKLPFSMLLEGKVESSMVLFLF